MIISACRHGQHIERGTSTCPACRSAPTTGPGPLNLVVAYGVPANCRPPSRSPSQGLALLPRCPVPVQGRRVRAPPTRPTPNSQHRKVTSAAFGSPVIRPPKRVTRCRPATLGTRPSARVQRAAPRPPRAATTNAVRLRGRTPARSPLSDLEPVVAQRQAGSTL